MHWNQSGMVRERWTDNGVAPKESADAVAARDSSAHTARQQDDEESRLELLRARNTVRDAITSRIEEADLHDDLQVFLLEYWSRLLLRIYQKYGNYGPAWEHALEVVEDMVDYIEASRSVFIKEELKAACHNIEHRFRNGLKVITVPEEVQRKFFSRLSEYYQDDFVQTEKSVLNMPFSAELLADNRVRERLTEES